jgi:NagD protein
MIRRPAHLYDAYIFDLDGTVYLGDALLPSAAETISSLRAAGCRTVFLSNNPTHTREAYAARLTGLGLPTTAADVVNSSFVMVEFLRRFMPGAQLFVAGEESLCGELRAGGFTLTEDAGRIQAVIASFDRTFTYRKLQVGFDALRAGARFFATNADRYCPVPGGGQPDAAAIIAAYEACTGRTVEAVVGKPSKHMASAILELLEVPPARCLMIGDRLETDVLLGLNAGMAAALTLTGATSADDVAGSRIQPTYVIGRLADLLPAAQGAI